MLLYRILAALVFGCVCQLTSGCFQNCTETFNKNMIAASQNTVPEQIASSTCRLAKEYGDCMKEMLNICDSNSKNLLTTTLNNLEQNYNTTCNENASAIVTKAIECSKKAGHCLKTFNVSTHLDSIDPALICGGLQEYTNCTEKLMTSQDCQPYMGQAAAQLEAMRNQYARVCSPEGPLSGGGGNAMECFNRTLNCYDQHSALLNIQDVTKNVEAMCRAMNEYGTCVSAVTADEACKTYAAQIQSGMQQTRNQHSALCGQDEGKTAGRCMRLFEACYTPFNSSFNPALKTNDFALVCEAVDALGVCTGQIADECIYYLGKALYGVEQIQKQYSYRCSPENRQHIACKPLEECTRNMIRSVMDRPVPASPASVCSNTVDTLFPCVEKAFKECNIKETGVQISKVAGISRDYCVHVTSDDSIKACPQILMCQMLSNFTMGDPLQMTNGTFWCGYVGASVDCISGVIQTNVCAGITAQKKTQLLQKLDSLQQQTVTACTKPTLTTSLQKPQVPGKPKVSSNKENDSSPLRYGITVVIMPLIISLV